MSLAAYFLLGVLLVGLVVELIIVRANIRDFGTPNSDVRPTISRQVWQLAQAQPWLVFVVGALFGHFLIPC